MKNKLNRNLLMNLNFGLGCMLVLTFFFSAHAMDYNQPPGSYDQQCKTASQAAKSKCEGAGKAVNAGDAAQSGAIGASMPGANIQPGATGQNQAISGQMGRIAGAQGQCQGALAQCKATCTQALAQAKADPHKKLQTPHPDVAKVPATMASECLQPIQKMLGELGEAQSNLGQDQQGTNQTQNAAQGGGMPPMSPPQMPKGDQKKDQPQQPQQQQQQQQQAGNSTPTCDGDQGARYSDCNEPFIEKCGSNMGGGSCETFGARYCGVTGGNSDPASGQPGGFLRPSFVSKSNGSLVVDKRGEGLGSNFCRKYNAHLFCKQSGRGGCPSCVNLVASSSPACVANPAACLQQNSPGQLESAKNHCPSDPIFTDPAYAGGGSGIGNSFSGASTDSKTDPTKLSQNPSGGSTGGAAGAAGGGGAGIGTGASASGASLSSDVEVGDARGDSNILKSMNMDTGGSGGGGSYGGSGSSDIDPFKLPDDQNRKPTAAAAGKTTAETSLAMDVSKKVGPNLFSISTSTYRALCESKRLKCN